MIHLPEACGPGDEIRTLGLIQRFISQAEEVLSELESAVQGGESETVYSLAHKWKGSCATCGVDALAASLDMLMEMARRERMRDASEVLREIRREWHRALDALQEYSNGKATHVPPAA